VTTDLPMPNVEGPLPAGQIADVPPTFEQLFHDEAAYVGRTLRYLGVREADLEDACQEVFVTVLRQLGQLRTASARAWVRQICVRVASHHRRSLRRRPEDTVAEPPDVAVPATQHGAGGRRCDGC
jgi:RNA polymerase sigma-70 factor (ECF subfamily)